MANQLDEIFAAMSFLGPVARVTENVVRWFYNALDLSRVIDRFIIDVDVMCRGAQQPWYLLANLSIFVVIVVLTSADVLDPLCFRMIWRTLIVERKEHRAEAIGFVLQRVEALLLLLIQTLFTLVTSRPLRLAHTSYCQDLPVSALTLVASILFMVPVVLVFLSAFLRGDGPSPPAAGFDSFDERLRGRRFAHETDRAHMHLKLSADGMTQRGWRYGGWRYALRLQAWKIKCLAKITCGYWDRDAVLATAIARRADCFLSHRLPTLPPEEHAVGLQMHQELMSATAKIASTMWMLLPAGIVITKFSEALNSPPWRIPEDVVEADSTSRWGADMAKLCRTDDIPNENKAMLIFNESEWVRRRRRTVQLSYVVLLLLFTIWPTEMTFLLLFGIIAAREIIELIFDQEEPTYWRRHQEWKKRVREVTFRQSFVDWVEPRRDGDPGACELVQIVAPEGSANSPASSCLMNAAESDSQNGDEASAREDAAEVVRADEEEQADDDEPLPPAYGRAPEPPTDFPEATAGDAAEDVAEAHDVDEARDVQIELAQVGEKFFREIS